MLAASAVGLVVLVIGNNAAGDRVPWSTVGIAAEFWALASAALAVGLLLQLIVSQHAARQREADLERAATQLRDASAELDRLARTDVLTGIANRRSLFDLMGVEFRRSRRYGRDLAVLMLDLDHFKDVNDCWGHPFGDFVLQEVAHLVTRNIRESDIVGRYGGEEFTVILPEASDAQGMLVAEKLRRAVEEHEFRTGDQPPHGEPPVRITISIGVAALPVDDEQDEIELFSRADQALYEAKRTGRNRVALYAKPPAITPPAAEAGGGRTSVLG